MKVWLGAGGLAIGIALGIALGFALDDDLRLQTEGDPPSATGVPQSCLDAIDAARDRLLLNPEVAETLRDYRAVAQDVIDAVRDLRLPDLRATLSQLNDLGERADELIQRSVGARFTANARACEGEAAATPSPTP